MADEITLGIKQHKAAQAEILLNNEVLKNAFQTLHDDYIATWKIAPVKDIDGKERLWQAVNILGKVQDHLKKVIIDGRIASKDLAAIKTLKR